MREVLRAAVHDRRPAVAALVHLAVALALIQFAYWRLFSFFGEWDDEGYLLQTLVAYGDGRDLYDEIYSQYGPFYYQVFGSLEALLRFGWSTDVGRLVTGMCWLVAATSFGVATTLVTRRLVVGVAAQLVVFATLDIMDGEPMHPSGLAVVGLGIVTLCWSIIGSRGEKLVPAGAAVAGLATGAVLLTKPNVGGFLVIGSAFAIVMSLLAGTRRAGVLGLAATAALALVPLALMAPDLDHSSIRTLALVLSMSLVTIGVVVVSSNRGPPLRVASRIARVGGGSLAVAIILSLGALLLSGTSAHGVLEGLVLEPLRLREAAFLPLSAPSGVFLLSVTLNVVGIVVALSRANAVRIPIVATVTTGGFVVVALVIALGPDGGLRKEVWGVLDTPGRTSAMEWSVIALGSCVLVAGLLIGHVRTQMGSLACGLTRVAVGVAGWSAVAGWSSFGTILLPASVAWIAVMPPSGVKSDPIGRLVRVFLASGAVLQAAQVYPVGGSQNRFGAVLLAVVSAVIVADGCAQLGHATLAWPRPRLAGASMASLALVAVVGYILIGGWSSRATYRSNIALDLPGASRLRVEPTLGRELRSLVAAVRERCSAVIGYPGLGSVQLWSGLAPVSALNPGAWMFLLDAQQQLSVVDALSAQPRPCVVRNEGLLDGWAHGRSIPGLPLVQRVEEFSPVSRHGDYTLEVESRTSGP